MFQEFLEAIVESRNEVTEFTDLIKDEKSKEIFELAEKSRRENPTGIKPWRHKDHQDWFTMDDVESKDMTQSR